MNIKPRIPIFLEGNKIGYNVEDWLQYFDWYNKLYRPEARILGNIPLLKRTDLWNSGEGYDTHHLRDNLESAAWSNYNYTLPENKDNVTADILYYADNSGKYTDILNFIDKYNKNIDTMFRILNNPYNYDMSDKSWTNFNRNYNLTYHSKGSGNGLSTILYDPTTEQYRGTSTHARRSDTYLKEFDDINDDEKWNRIHKITLNGQYYYVAKEANGHLRLLGDKIGENKEAPINSTNISEKLNRLRALEKVDPYEEKKKSFREKLISGFRNIAPDALDAARLIGTLHTNNKVFSEILKGIRPSLQLSYHTYRLVVGDEATKQAYYRRAVQGQTKAAQPFTSDADRQVAYMLEARRVGDELRAQGDLADNLRIRETSELASLHADANRERDTTVANNNLLEINKANAAKQLLKALKLLADWTNIDLYLLGTLSKLLLKNNERKLYDRQLAQITMQQDLLNDPNISTLQSDRDKALEAYSNDKNNPTLKKAFEDANKKYQNYMLLKKKNWYEQGLYIAKSGTKLEYKDKSDKFLYKVSKDIVDHFRRITKMTDDSRVRTLPKTVKLTPHPKAKKMLLGGVAPFYIYRPLGLGGGESTVSTQTSTSSSSSKSSSDKKSEAEKDKLDLIKELFKSVSASALPVDTSLIYKDISNTIFKAKALGEELTTDDLASMYLSSMLKLTYLKYSKDAYEKAYNQAVANDAIDEIAVASDNSLFLLDQETGKIKKGTISDILKSGGKLNPLTNGLLLTARAHSPNLAFNDEIFDVVNRGVGMNKIAAQIKNLASTIGSSEQKIEGISQVESNRIKAGLQTLAGFDGTPDGYYKITRLTKDSLNNIQAALEYIYGMLPNNYKTIMKLHFGDEDNSIKMIGNMLVSQANNSYLESISPLTGKASDKEDSLDKLSSNPLLAMQREIGGSPINYSIITRDSNTKMSVNGTLYSAIPKVKEDMSVDKMLSVSGIDGIITSKYGITFGDLQIDPSNLKDIMYSNTGGVIVTLPCKIVNGIKQVNLDVREAYERAESKALQVSQDRLSLLFIKALGEELKNEHLDSLLDSNGLPNKNMFLQFLIVEGYTTDKINLKKDSLYIEKISSPDSNLESRISTALSTDSKKSNYSIDIDDHWGFLEGGWDDIYRGTIFIPLNNNPNAAINSWGGSSNISQSTEMEELYLISNKSANFNKNNLL